MKQKTARHKLTHERLAAEGFSPLAVRSKISTIEKGKRYVLVTTGLEESVIYAIDGNIVNDGPRAATSWYL